MTLLEAFTKLTAGEPALKAFLEQAATNPSLAPEANAILAKLEGSVTADNLAALAAVIPGELLNIVKGKFDGDPHPSDLA